MIGAVSVGSREERLVPRDYRPRQSRNWNVVQWSVATLQPALCIPLGPCAAPSRPQHRTLLQAPARDRSAVVAGPGDAAALPAALEQARRARRHRLLDGLALDPCGSHAVLMHQSHCLSSTAAVRTGQADPAQTA